MRRLSLIMILLFNLLLCQAQEAYLTILRASALREQDKPSQAVAILSAEISRSASPALYRERGEAFLSSGDIRSAEKDFMTAEAMSQGTGLYGLSRCAAARGDARAATGYLEALMKTDFRKTEPQIMLDSVFRPVMSSTEWKEFWKKNWYKGYEKSMWSVGFYLKSGMTGMAREEYSSLKALYPGTEAEEYCGALIDLADGRTADAIKVLSEIDSGDKLKPEVTKALASAYAAQGDFLAAAAQYGKLIRAEYNDAGLFLLRGQMLREGGDRDGALKDFELYLSLYPDDYRALELTGKTLAEEGLLYKALPYMNRNIEMNPGKAQAYSDRGDAYFSCRSWDNAVADYSMSLDLNPSDGQVYLNMSVALISSGRSSEACPFLRKALQLGQKDAAKYISRYCNR